MFYETRLIDVKRTELLRIPETAAAAAVASCTAGTRRRKGVHPEGALRSTHSRLTSIICALAALCLTPPVSAQVSVVSAASYQSTISPGSLATIFGANLATETLAGSPSADGTYPKQVGGATVTVGGAASASASDATNIAVNPPPKLTVSMNHSGSFIQGQSGATYTVTVSNDASAGPTNGTIMVTDNLLTGPELVPMAGAGWTCSGNSCTNATAINPGSSDPLITIAVNVAANAPAQVTNQVLASGGGSPSMSASDTTTISASAPVSSPAPGESASVLYLPRVQSDQAFETGLAFASTESRPGTVSISAFSSNGQLVKQAPFSLSSHGQIVGTVRALLGLSSDFIGWARVDSDVDVQGLCLLFRRSDGLVSEAPAVKLPDGTQYLAHVAVGGGWQTKVSVANTSPVATAARLMVFDQTGAILSTQLWNPGEGERDSGVKANSVPW